MHCTLSPKFPRIFSYSTSFPIIMHATDAKTQKIEPESSFKTPLIESILSEVPALIQESDMRISQVAIMLITCMAKVCPSSLSKIWGIILSEVLNLVHSPLPQRGALNSILEFFHVLVATKANNMGYSDLLKALRGPFYDFKSTDSMSMHKQSYYLVAKCVTALSMACSKEASGVVTNLIQEVN